MPETLDLIRIRINELDLAGVEDYYLTARQHLASLDGFYGHSLWRGVGRPDDMMACFEYRDSDAAVKGIQLLSSLPLLASMQAAEYRPADLLRVQVEGRHGRKVSEAPRPGYLSMTIRVADPGYGQTLADQIGLIFEELAIIPGDVGSVYGFSEALPEEVIGLVVWSSEQAFASSLPPKQKVREVKLYERVF